MKGMNRRFRYGLGSAGVVLTALCMISTLAFAQGNLTVPVQGGKPPVPVAGDFDKVKMLPPGGPAPRLPDGHIDLSGRWYPNRAGRMLQVAYPVPADAFFHLDRDKEKPPVFKPGAEATARRPSNIPPGECGQAGVPNTLLEQAGQHAPMEFIHLPGGSCGRCMNTP